MKQTTQIFLEVESPTLMFKNFVLRKFWMKSYTFQVTANTTKTADCKFHSLDFIVAFKKLVEYRAVSNPVKHLRWIFFRKWLTAYSRNYFSQKALLQMFGRVLHCGKYHNFTVLRLRYNFVVLEQKACPWIRWANSLKKIELVNKYFLLCRKRFFILEVF